MEPLIKQARETISASLGPTALESEMQAGKRMVRDEAIAYALEEKKPSRVAGPPTKTSTKALNKRGGENAGPGSGGPDDKGNRFRGFLCGRDVGAALVNHP